MAIEFKLPELGEGVDSADVAEIQVSEGDAIEADQNVMELETEKAVADLPCPHAGTVSKIHVSPGDTVKVGDTLLTIEEAEEAAEEKDEQHEETETAEEEGEAEEDTSEEEPQQTEAAEEPEQPPEEREEPKEKRPAAKKKAEPEEEAKEKTEKHKQPAVATAEKRARKRRAEGDGRGKMPPPAGPATRRLARKLDVDLERIEGSGPSGRITQEDVVRLHESAAGPARAAAAKLPDFSKFGEVEESPLNKLAKTAIRNLTTSWQTIPHVTQHGLADITELEEERRRYVSSADESSPKVTLTAIAVKAAVAVLKEFPHFNASLDVERGVLILKRYFHLGVAVDTEEGLVVPVIRDADKKGITTIAADLIDLAEKARERKLSSDDMQGATFTISNQGGIGGTSFTPIVNFPEVAILGLSKAEKRQLVIDDEPQIRLVLPLSLSYDHRAINGADAARFVERLAAILSDPSLLLFES